MIKFPIIRRKTSKITNKDAATNNQQNSPEIFCLGELLVDFLPTPAHSELLKTQRLKMAPGGAPANVAVALSRLGVHSGFIGKAGDDIFGQYLQKTLKDVKVDLTYFSLHKGAPTRLAFITNHPDEAQGFLFYGTPGADELLNPNNIPHSFPNESRFLHFGSISLINEPSRSATLTAISRARQNKLIISFDPNLRLELWPNRKKAKKEIISTLRLCHVLKVNLAEWNFLFPEHSFKKSWSLLEKKGIKLAALTLGDDGALLINKQTQVRIKGLKIKNKDTTGAGDAFVAGLLYCLKKNNKELERYNRQDLRRIGLFANSAGALTCTKVGAAPAFPNLQSVTRLVEC